MENEKASKTVRENLKLALVAPTIHNVDQRDMDFMRESWDNMPEIDQVDKDGNRDEKFQLVVPMKNKKHQKQQTEASK